MDNGEPFWRRKSLGEMSADEWESLCDGCARCCLNKLEDWDTGEIYWTDIACGLLDADHCRCTNYAKRHALMPDCVALTPANVPEIDWLPPTCAYRLIDEGRDLYWWHPLVSGDPETVHQAGISVRGRVISEIGLSEADYEDHLVDWPGEDSPAEELAGVSGGWRTGDHRMRGDRPEQRGDQTTAAKPADCRPPRRGQSE